MRVLRGFGVLMPNEKVERHYLYDRKIQIYRRQNSANWWVSFSVDGKQKRKSTGKRDLDEAKQFSERLFSEYRVALVDGVRLDTPEFIRVARENISIFVRIK